MDWDRLRVFHAVVEAGSFTKAGRSLDLSQSAISRQIGSLEETLGVALFHRHTRGVVLTEQGEDFHATVREMAAKLAMARARINERRDQPEGPLKITTTVAFGSAWLTSRMNSFHTLYPDIAVSLLLVDNVELDLFRRQADVAIRFEPQLRPNLVQCRLMSIRYHLFASPEYLARHPAPACAADLDDHEIIVYGDDMSTPVADINWILEAGASSPRRPALSVNSVYGIYRAVRSGFGIAALPYYLTEESPELVEVLPDLHGPAIDAFLVYPEELRHSRRIAAVRDFLLEQASREDTGRTR